MGAPALERRYRRFSAGKRAHCPGLPPRARQRPAGCGGPECPDRRAGLAPGGAYYHVASMATTGTTLVLVEHLGLGGRGGSRLRLLELTSGETLAIYDLFRPDQSERGSSRQYVSAASAVPGRLINPEAGRSGLRRPLIMADGSIVAWSSRENSPNLEAYCFDSQLALRWTKPKPRWELHWAVMAKARQV